MREWRNPELDKASWGSGAWSDEADKVQWVDEATGLDCLIVRNNGGALCGYVGVPESHPLYGVGYSEEVAGLGAMLEARKERPLGESPGVGVLLACLSGEVKASPAIVFEVHGGITFADACQEPTRAEYAAIPTHLADPARNAEALRHPEGDAARNLASLRRQQAMTFEEWVEDQNGRRICHVPAPDRPAKVWWFGFDCAHAGDFSPAYDAFSRRLGFARERGEAYRDRGYVEVEVGRLASQIARIGAVTAPSPTKAAVPNPSGAA